MARPGLRDWIDEIFTFLDCLATGEVLGEDPTTNPRRPTTGNAWASSSNRSDMLADLHHHRIDALTPRTPRRREMTPDRNDPCPCGSGKKYKKCHGAG